MIKVLEVTGEPIYHGGQEKFISNLVDGLSETDYLIDVMTPYDIDNEEFCNLINNNGGNVFHLDLEFEPGRSRRNLYGKVLQFLREKNYDIVHIHSGSVSVLAYEAKAAKKAGIKKIIVHSHSDSIHTIKHTIIKCLFGNMIIKSATHFLACSYEAGTDKFPKKIVENKMRIIPNGISVNSFKRDNEKRERMRNNIGLNKSAYVIGNVGRFSREKNHSFLIDVFNEVHKVDENSCLLLVGDGELIDEIKAKVNRLGIEKHVIFVGNVDNVADYYQAMDVFVFPSLFEGFGYAALEAQAAGLPCVISSEVPKDVAIGKNVKIMPLDNFDGWAQTILDFQITEIVDNEKAILEAGYSVSRTVSKVNELYLNTNN